MTTPRTEYSALDCYAAFCELAAALQAGQSGVAVQAAVLALSEITLGALRASPVSHLDAVVAETSELIRTLAATEAATVDA